MTINYQFKQIKPNIFHLCFDDQYQMCMTFLRCQEFYESPEFCGKTFTIIDFMEWYSKTYGNGNFTYPTDWSGFNINDQIIKQTYAFTPIDDNIYDIEMRKIYQQCIHQATKFSLIASVKDDRTTILHETAHAFYYLYPYTYKHSMNALLKQVPVKIKDNIFSYFKSVGYTPRVFLDEAQAYLATGIDKPRISKKIQRPFIELFQSYYNK